MSVKETIKETIKECIKQFEFEFFDENKKWIEHNIKHSLEHKPAVKVEMLHHKNNNMFLVYVDDSTFEINIGE